VTEEDRRLRYRRLAVEAQELAAMTSDPSLQEAMLKIAHSYQLLAEQEGEAHQT
jgi:hypothetical protein